MYSVTVTCPLAEQDRVLAILWELGTAGVTQDANWLCAFFADEVAQETVLLQLQGFDARLDTPVPDGDWTEQWKEAWQPFALGERLYLAPPWDATPTPAGRLRVHLRPGMACGSGLHPCTRLCLECMEKALLPGEALLDVGTGSGILAEAGFLLGARPVIACDIDDEATRIAAENLNSAGIAARCFTGSLRSLRAGAFPCVVANLNAVTLQAIAPELRRVATGVLILSGFREQETATVAAHVGLPLRVTAELDGWGAVILGTDRA